MKKVLILCLHRPNRSPSQRFRFEQYLNFLQENGYQFDFSYLLNAEQDKAYYAPGQYAKKMSIVLSSTWKRLKELFKVKQYDLVFVQREAYMLGTAFFERYMGSKLPMIFDYDDSIWIPQVSDGNKKLAFLKDASKTSRIIEKASLVFAGNQHLANYAKQYNRNVVIIPTTIDTEIYKRQESVNHKDAVCIGWSGSFTTIEHFETAIPVLKKIKEKYGNKVYFKIIGDGNYYCKELNTQGAAWNAATEVKDLSEIEIGIMPLPDTEWTKGKCGLKGLSYMALGIPTLMSPVGVNNEIISNGQNGYLPNGDDEWICYLSQLIEDKNLRKSIGAAGKETVDQKFSTRVWQQSYLNYFNQLTS
jgi:glycosyltransferase involved in cell wall biosynthesis